MEPQNYWVNTSSNDIVRRFIDRADAAARDEIERLINGDSIKKEIRQEALKQIRDKNYEASLTDDGIKTIYKIKSLYNFLISY